MHSMQADEYAGILNQSTHYGIMIEITGYAEYIVYL